MATSTIIKSRGFLFSMGDCTSWYIHNTSHARNIISNQTSPNCRILEIESWCGQSRTNLIPCALDSLFPTFYVTIAFKSYIPPTFSELLKIIKGMAIRIRKMEGGGGGGGGGGVCKAKQECCLAAFSSTRLLRPTEEHKVLIDSVQWLKPAQKANRNYNPC